MSVEEEFPPEALPRDDVILNECELKEEERGERAPARLAPLEFRGTRSLLRQRPTTTNDDDDDDDAMHEEAML